VVNDGGTGGNRTIDWAALHAVFGKLHRFLVSAFSNRNALYAHAKTGSVHHDEHVFQATVFFTYQVAHSTAMVTVLQDGSWAG
jgi:hypothetical protein